MINHGISSINPLKPSDAQIGLRPCLALFQIMACRLFGEKQFPEPMVASYQFDT